MVKYILVDDQNISCCNCILMEHYWFHLYGWENKVLFISNIAKCSETGAFKTV